MEKPGEIIKRYRKLRGMTQENLAYQTGYSRQQVIAWEKDKSEMRPITIEIVSATLGIPLDLLYAARGILPPDIMGQMYTEEALVEAFKAFRNVLSMKQERKRLL